MEVNKKRLSEIFGVSIRTIQNWQDQGMPFARGGGISLCPLKLSVSPILSVPARRTGDASGRSTAARLRWIEK